jgi:hypothetical protein
MTIEIVSGPAAIANVANERFFLMLYGPPGSQKTTDAVKTFARPDGTNGAFFIPCEDGALKPILARGIPVPDHPKDVVTTWAGLTEAVVYAGQHRNKYTAVIIDTISTWTSNVYKDLTENFKGKNRYDIPVAMRKMLFDLRVGARGLGLHVIMIAHEMPPQYDFETNLFKGPGGPLLQPKTAIELFYGAVDTVLRITSVQTGLTRSRVYQTGGETWPPGVMVPGDSHLWRAKNREGCGNAIVDADLGAFLRARQPAYAGL